MIKNYNLNIDTLLSFDDTGMPVLPNIRQLIDKDVRELFGRDKTKDKQKYIADAIVIYYLGDPKSPAKQSGLSDAEALKEAIIQAGLPIDYIPDALVIKLIEKYHKYSITEAGRVIENIQQGIHNINLSITAINNLLNDKLNNTGINIEDIANIISMVDSVNKKASDLPSLIKKLTEAKENLMYEKETETSRGGGKVLSSMDADSY